MPYEMNHVEGMTPAETRVHDEAVARFDEAVRVRNKHPRGSAEMDREQDRVDTTYTDMHHTDLSHFFLTEIGVKRWREAMDDFKMTTMTNRPVWPELSSHGLDFFPDDHDGAKLLPRERTFLSAIARTRRVVPTDPGIGGWKLESRDDWWVSPHECATALEVWHSIEDGTGRLAPYEIQPDRWSRWLAFLERAVRRGGFLVQ